MLPKESYDIRLSMGEGDKTAIHSITYRKSSPLNPMNTLVRGAGEIPEPFPILNNSISCVKRLQRGIAILDTLESD